MSAELLKTAVITALDAAPPTRSSSGQGGPGNLRCIDGTLTITTGKTAPSIYQMVRIPSNAKVKHVYVCLDAANTTLTADIGLYYATDPTTQASLQGTAVNSTTGTQLYGTAIDLHAIITPTDYTNESTSYVAAKRLQPAWQAAGLSVDPGGFFDVCLTTTATNSGAAVVYMEVQYVE